MILRNQEVFESSQPALWLKSVLKVTDLGTNAESMGETRALEMGYE